jgi:hypothetical protein
VTKLTLSIILLGLPVMAASHGGGGAAPAARPASAPARVANPGVRASAGTGRSAGFVGAGRSAGGFGFRIGGGTTKATAPQANTSTPQRFAYTPLSAPRLSSPRTAATAKATTASVAPAGSNVTVVKNITTTNISYQNGGWGWRGWYGPWWIGPGYFYYYPGQFYWDPILDISFAFRLRPGNKKCPTGIQFDLKPAGKYKAWAKDGVAQELDPDTDQLSIIGDVGKIADNPLPLAAGFHAIQVTFSDGRVLKLPVSVFEGHVTPVPIVFGKAENAIPAPSIVPAVQSQPIQQPAPTQQQPVQPAPPAPQSQASQPQQVAPGFAPVQTMPQVSTPCEVPTK